MTAGLVLLYSASLVKVGFPTESENTVSCCCPCSIWVFYQNVGEEESYLFTQKGEMQPNISKYFVILLKSV
jgi:hypothetical protein